MAVMVEGVQRRKTKRGKDFVITEFSDSSGQFSASCFEESLVEPMLGWANDGTCLLLNVELDAPSPDEPPRITVRSARPLASVTSAARMVLSLEVHRPEALSELALMLARGAYLEKAACNDPDCDDCKRMRASDRQAWKVHAAKALHDAFQTVELMMTQTKGRA